MEDNYIDHLFWTFIHHLYYNEGFFFYKEEDNYNKVYFLRKSGKENELFLIQKDTFLWKRDYIQSINELETEVDQYLSKEMKIKKVYTLTFSDSMPYEWHSEGNYYSFTQDEFVNYYFTKDISFYEMTSLLINRLFQRPIEVISTPIQFKYDFQKEIGERIQRHTEERSKIFSDRKPILNYVMLAIIAFVFIFIEGRKSTDTFALIDFGAKFNPLIMEGQLWRFVTPIFLHIGVLHLFMNGMALYYIGKDVEQIYGKIRYLVIFLVSGIIGVIASFAFSFEVSAGASGAIFGLFGALLYLTQRHSKWISNAYKKNIVSIIIINIIFGMAVPGIDQAGHLGGFAGGYLAAVMVGFPKDRQYKKQLLATLALALGTLGLFYYGYENNLNAPKNELLMGEYYRIHHNYEAAYSHYMKAVEGDTHSSAETYFSLAYLEFHLEKYEDSLEHFQYAAKKDSLNDKAFYNMALISLKLNDFDGAMKNIKKALEIKPNDKMYLELYDKMQVSDLNQ